MNTETKAMTPLATALARLVGFDFIVAIDASGSMGDPVTAGSTKTRWDHVQETAVSFSRDLALIDDDGIGVVMFSGNTITPQNNCNADAITKIFATRSPRNGTPLAEALTACLTLGATSDKKKMIVVFTDGVPDNGPAAAKVIVDQSKKQETDDELTFVFIQVGDDAKASAYLKSLDDELTAAGAKFDIVSCYTMDEVAAFDSTAELLSAAIDG